MGIEHTIAKPLSSTRCAWLHIFAIELGLAPPGLWIAIDFLQANDIGTQSLQAHFKRAITRVSWPVDLPELRQNAEAHRVAADQRHNSET